MQAPRKLAVLAVNLQKPEGSREWPPEACLPSMPCTSSLPLLVGALSLPKHAVSWTCDLAPSILLQSRSAIMPRPSSCLRVTCICSCCSLLLFRCSKGQSLACRFQRPNPTERFTWAFAEALPLVIFVSISHGAGDQHWQMRQATPSQRSLHQHAAALCMTCWLGLI